MNNRTKLARLRAYLEHGIARAEQEHREHKDVLVLEQWQQTVSAPCGTVGCALGSFAMSAKGRQMGWWWLGDWMPVWKKWAGDVGLSFFLDVHLDTAELLCGSPIPATRREEAATLRKMRRTCERLIAEVEQ